MFGVLTPGMVWLHFLSETAAVFISFFLVISSLIIVNSCCFYLVEVVTAVELGVDVFDSVYPFVCLFV